MAKVVAEAMETGKIDSMTRSLRSIFIFPFSFTLVSSLSFRANDVDFISDTQAKLESTLETKNLKEKWCGFYDLVRIDKYYKNLSALIPPDPKGVQFISYSGLSYLYGGLKELFELTQDKKRQSEAKELLEYMALGLDTKIKIWNESFSHSTLWPSPHVIDQIRLHLLHPKALRFYLKLVDIYFESGNGTMVKQIKHDVEELVPWEYEKLKNEKKKIDKIVKLCTAKTIGEQDSFPEISQAYFLKLGVELIRTLYESEQFVYVLVRKSKILSDFMNRNYIYTFSKGEDIELISVAPLSNSLFSEGVPILCMRVVPKDFGFEMSSSGVLLSVDYFGRPLKYLMLSQFENPVLSENLGVDEIKKVNSDLNRILQDEMILHHLTNTIIEKIGSLFKEKKMVLKEDHPFLNIVFDKLHVLTNSNSDFLGPLNDEERAALKLGVLFSHTHQKIRNIVLKFLDMRFNKKGSHPSLQCEVSNFLVEMDPSRQNKVIEKMEPFIMNLFAFVPIPKGAFMMGSPESEIERSANEKQHRVELTKSFEMQSGSVTQRQWFLVTGKNPSFFKREEDCKDFGVEINGVSLCPHHPVENVSWDDVQEFIRKINQLSAKNQYRLPTEAEWEYAARGGSEEAYFFGNHSKQLNEYGWYNQNSGNQTHEVATKRPNGYGLFDMHGNVGQWVQDRYDAYLDKSVEDPRGPDSGDNRVVRGGSWNDEAWKCRSAYRQYHSPDFRYYCNGFRLVRDLRQTH